MFNRRAARRRPGLLKVEPPRSGARAGRSGIVKGFRMPASHCARGCTEAGVRKASKEETAGGVCACGSVGLWGFDQPIASAVKGPGAAEGAIPRTAARKLDGGAGI